MILLRYLKFYLLNEMHPSPLLFFTLFILKDLLSNLAHYYLIIYFLALFLALWKNYNMLYILPVCLHTQNSYLSLLFFLTSALSCTKRWKVYLFIYTLAQTYLISGNYNANFSWAVSGAMCFIIYKNLIFQTSGEDVKYFIGFFITCILYLCFALASYIKIQLNIYSLLLVLWISALLSHSIINKRLKEIRSMKIQQIKHPAIIIRYIHLQLEDLQQKTVELAKLKLHFDECRLVKCSCKTNKYSKDFYVRQMFQHFMKSLGSLGDERLWQYYIDFYLSKDHFVIPYYNLLKWRPKSYFSLINKLKTQAKIAKLLQRANQKITYDKQYIYGLQYDKKCQNLSSQIYQILKLKIDFWKEVGGQSLSLKKLQNLGLKIIDRMQKLNYFYTHTIKQYEKYLYCFDFTILYAIYLIFSTNFKDYADSLVKNIAKILQKGSMKENNTSQTFVIKAVVQNSKISLTKRYTRSFQNQKEISTLLKLEEMYQNQFKLIIDAVSNGFCKIVNIPKKQIIGSQLNSLIPNCYKEIHNVRLTQILDFNSDVIKELLPSQVLHSNLVLLFKGANDQLFAGLICIKYNMDINAGLSFLSVIKKPTQNKCIALTNLSGVLMQKQKGFPCEIIKHQEVRRYLAKLKKTWLTNRTIQEQKFNLSINRISYEFTIDSPYAHLLSDKACLSNNQPPIHIQLLDEQSVKNRFINQIHGRNHFRDQVTKIQKMIKEQKQTSIASSIKTTSSNRAGAAVTIINNFWQNNSIPVYKYIIVTFTIILICNTILNLIINLKYIMQWNNISIIQNPIVDITNLYNIQILLTKAAMNFQDTLYYQKYQILLNKSLINSYYQGKTFQQWNSNTLLNIAQQLQSSMADIWVNYSTLLWPQIQQRFNNDILVDRLIKTENSYNLSTHTLTYGQLLFNFAVDNMLILFSNKHSGLLFPHLLTQVRYQTLSLIQFSDIVSKSFDSADTIQLVLGVVFTTLIIICIFPMCLALRMRGGAHERVFDLLSSIDCQSIKKEIQSLLYISNILNNYNQYKYKFNHYLITQQSSFFINRDSKPDNNSSSVFRNIIKGREDQRSQTSINIPLKNCKKIDTENILFHNLKYNGWQKDQTSELFRSIKSEIFEQMSKKASLKYRKRSGQLNLAGSEHDPKKYFTCRHCTIYLLLLSFVPFVLSSMFISKRYIQHSQSSGQQIYNSYMQTHLFNTKIREIKTYLWEGTVSLKNTYNMTDQLTIVQDMLVNSPNFTSFNSDEQDDFSTPHIDEAAKFRKSINTLRLIQSEILSIVHILVQLRYSLQHNSNITPTQSQYQILYEQIFYLQLLINQRQDENKNIAKYLQEDMFKICIQCTWQKRIILIVLLTWSLISYGLGMILIHKMKHQYFEEVCILSFLNNEMLSKNKRVQSYLDNLSKNTNY